MNGPEAYGMSPQVLCSVIRLATLVQDAWFAALALESGCEWITTDGDFARFPALRWRRPLPAA